MVMELLLPSLTVVVAVVDKKSPLVEKGKKQEGSIYLRRKIYVR